MEKIVLLKLNTKRKRLPALPKSVEDEVAKKIGSEFRRGTRDTIRGLDSIQEKVILPDIIGVSPTDVSWSTKTRDFWSEMTIIPTAEGIKLNITTEKKTTTINGQEEEVEIPVNPFDYMRWKFAAQSRRVAVTPEQLENLDSYDFYIIDLTEAKNKERNEFAEKKAAKLAYAKLSADIENRVEVVDQVIQVLKEVGEYFDTDMEIADKDMLLEKLSNEKPNAFVKAVNDPQLEIKAKLKTSISLGLITKEGDQYFFGSTNLGPIKAALAYLSDKANSATVATLNARLESVKASKSTNKF